MRALMNLKKQLVTDADIIVNQNNFQVDRKFYYLTESSKSSPVDKIFCSSFKGRTKNCVTEKKNTSRHLRTMCCYKYIYLR